MLKQWRCSRHLWFAWAPGVLTVADDRLTYFSMFDGLFDHSVEMRLRDIIAVTSTNGLWTARISITSVGQSMILSIDNDSAEVVAKYVQSAVDKVKLELAESVGNSASAVQDGPSS